MGYDKFKVSPPQHRTTTKIHKFTEKISFEVKTLMIIYENFHAPLKRLITELEGESRENVEMRRKNDCVGYFPKCRILEIPQTIHFSEHKSTFHL